MSWLARSIVNTLSFNDDERERDNDTLAPTPDNSQKQTKDSSSPPSSPRGVKEDLSELTKTLTRELWGVASFLVPPPQSDRTKDSKSVPEESDSDRVAGFRSEFAEISGKFRSGFSKLSDNIHVAEISKMASDFLQLAEADDDEEGDGFGSADGTAVGVTEQVVAFARDIAMHPETWLDFPLPEDQDDGDDDEDFDMSDAQQEHALAVERLAPRLAALRIELCPGYMSEAQFWKVYFVLLHPRLDKQDALVLSTPQIMKARASLATELQKRSRAILDDKPGEPTMPSEGIASFQNEVSLSALSSDPPSDVFQTISATELATPGATDDSFPEKHPITSDEISVVDKAMIGEGNVNQNKDHNMPSSGNSWEKNEEDDNDDWLKEESSGIGGPSGTTFSMENEEDVSFSDLEEDDEDEHTKVNKVNDTSDKDSRDWVELSKSSGVSSSNMSVGGATKVNLQPSGAKESNDWLDLDDTDVA